MKVTDESTIVMKDGSPVQKPNKKSGKKSDFWKGVLVGGVPAILLSSANTVLGANVPEDIDADMQESENVDGQAADVLDAALSIDVAESVTDEMSFSEAFEAARAEVGPGGVFEWNGNLYSTYYEDEWNNMTDEQKEEFADSLYDFDSTEGVAEVEVEAVSVEYADNYHETSNTEGQVNVLAEDVVEVDGQLVTVTSVEVDGHYGEVYDLDNDGQYDAAMFDVNDDGNPDVAMYDANADGYIDGNEVCDLSRQENMMAMNYSSPEDALYDGMPDYTNDADTSYFA